MKTNQLSLIIVTFSLTVSTAAFAQTPVKISNQSWKQKTLTTQEKKNLALVLHFMNDGIGKADLKIFDESLSKDVIVQTGLKPSGPITGVEEYKSTFGPFASAFPVTEFIIDEAFATDDKVVIRFQAIAYFKDDYYGVKATNQVINLKEAHILTVKNNKIVSNVVSGTNFPFEYLMYPVLKDAVIGNLPLYKSK